MIPVRSSDLVPGVGVVRCPRRGYSRERQVDFAFTVRPVGRAAALRPGGVMGHVFYTHGPEMTVFRTVFCRYDSACEKLPLKCLALQVKSPLASRASSSRGGIPCRECSPRITYFCSTLASATSRAEKKKHSAFESFIFIII